jgi:polyferredoxin
MNTKNLIIASLIGGLISIILSNVPVINLVNCLLCAGFWLGPLFAVWFYKRQSGTVTLGQGAAIGALAGVWAGVFGLFLALFNLAGFASMIETYAQFMPPDAVDMDPSLLGAMGWLFNFLGVGFDIVVGTIGGLIGGAIWKEKTPASPPPPATPPTPPAPVG